MYHDQRNVTLRDGRNTEPSSVDVSFDADRTSDIVELSACTLSDLIASREVSCVEVGVNSPAGFCAEGCRWALQILAKPRRDQACLQLAHGYEQVTRWTSIRPLEAASLGGDINGRACA